MGVRPIPRNTGKKEIVVSHPMVSCLKQQNPASLFEKWGSDIHSMASSIKDSVEINFR